MGVVNLSPAKSKPRESIDEIALVLKAVLIADSDDGDPSEPNSQDNIAFK